MVDPCGEFRRLEPVHSSDVYLSVIVATPSPPDTTPPSISAVAVANITSSTASINWMTNEPADGQVEFVSPCPSNGCVTSIVSTLATAHAIDVAGLAASTT